MEIRVSIGNNECQIRIIPSFSCYEKRVALIKNIDSRKLSTINQCIIPCIWDGGQNQFSVCKILKRIQEFKVMVTNK